jgi:two-component system, OmpR family, phosphate regulon sensor histidine kinase PhoR
VEWRAEALFLGCARYKKVETGESPLKRLTVLRLATAWTLLFAGFVLAAMIWLKPWRINLNDGQSISEFVTTGVALAAAFAAGGFLISYAFLRRWANYAEELRRVAVALPPTGQRPQLTPPPEMAELTHAILHTTSQVKSTVERAMLESSRRETILAGMAEGVLAVDNKLVVVFYNEAFAHAFQARLPVAEGRPLYEVVREPALHNMLETVVRSGQSAREQFQLPSAAGHWFEAHALPFLDGQNHGAIVVLHDVSDIQRQEQARRDFVANVSHELRTPLAAIRGYAETLLDGALDDAANNRRFVEVILAHAVRLNNIASDLLVLSELDSNAPALPPDRVNVLEVIDSAVRTVESSATLRQIRLIQGKCEDCVVIAYRFRLEQALVNLLDNAVKFNRPEGEVSVECGSAGNGTVRIAVSDTGIGIPSEDLKRIFERFYRVDKARSRRAGGTGLGLSIVKQIIERMGGSVGVESQLGRGTRFIITLQSFQL